MYTPIGIPATTGTYRLRHLTDGKHGYSTLVVAIHNDNLSTLRGKNPAFFFPVNHKDLFIRFLLSRTGYLSTLLHTFYIRDSVHKHEEFSQMVSSSQNSMPNAQYV
nr:MAG TPA: hypothetical protein [Caudoviricetes sp.]DAX28639.1 MAG TPA: hypothetical protein [Caudoviricetes sp.]